MSEIPDCTPTAYGPCAPYLTVEELVALGCGCSEFDLAPVEAEPGPDAALISNALLWASRRVFMATGYRFWGCCEATIRPCRASCAAGVAEPGFPADWPWSTWPWAELPAAWGSGLVPVWACGCPAGDPCSCTAWDRIALPLLPARDVLAVTIDGEDLDPAAYALVADAWLLRIDGDRWPSCQAVEKPLSEPGTWAVRYRHGLDLPPEALPLVGLYACELAKACRGGDCALGPGIRVASRDGVEFAVAEPSDYRERGLVGFGPLDDWISLLNGGHVTEPPRIYRPGREAPSPLIGVPP